MFNFLVGYYTLILGFCGQHPLLTFFTFPLWAILLLFPLVIVGYLIDELVLPILKKLLRLK